MPLPLPLSRESIMHQSIPAAPCPPAPAGLTPGKLPFFGGVKFPGVGALRLSNDRRFSYRRLSTIFLFLHVIDMCSEGVSSWKKKKASCNISKWGFPWYGKFSSLFRHWRASTSYKLPSLLPPLTESHCGHNWNLSRKTCSSSETLSMENCKGKLADHPHE